MAGRQAARKAQRDRFGFALQADSRRDFFPVRERARMLDREIGGMQDHGGTGSRDLNRDPDLAAEMPGIEVRIEVKIVFRRTDFGR